MVPSNNGKSRSSKHNGMTEPESTDGPQFDEYRVGKGEVSNQAISSGPEQDVTEKSINSETEALNLEGNRELHIADPFPTQSLGSSAPVVEPDSALRPLSTQGSHEQRYVKEPSTKNGPAISEDDEFGPFEDLEEIQGVDFVAELNREMDEEERRKQLGDPRRPSPESKPGYASSVVSGISGGISGLLGRQPKSSMSSPENSNRLQKPNNGSRGLKNTGQHDDELSRLKKEDRLKANKIYDLELEIKSNSRLIKSLNATIAADRPIIEAHHKSKQRISELERVKKSLEDNIAGWKLRDSQWEKIRDRQNIDIDILKGDLEQAKESFRLRNLDVMKAEERLMVQLNEERSKTKNTIASANLLQAVSEKKELFIGPQEVDVKISDAYSALISKVKTWSSKFKDLYLDFDQAHPFTKDHYRNIVPNWSDEDIKSRVNDLKYGRKLRLLFVQGWIGAVLAGSIFCSFRDGDHEGSVGKDIWVEDAISEAIYTLEAKLNLSDRSRLPFKDFNDWRAMTIVRLYTAQDLAIIKERFESVSRNWASKAMELSGWTSVTKSEEHINGLASIFADAQRLNQLMRSQRASWQVRHPTRKVPINITEEDGKVREITSTQTKWCLKFDPECMKDQAQDWESGDAVVDLVLAPALYKQGDMDGERFDAVSCIVPSLVTLVPEAS